MHARAARALVLVMAVALLVTRTAGWQPALRCRHERCQNTGLHTYVVDGNDMEVSYDNGRLLINCHGANLLESSALPFAEPALRVPHVILRNCPLLATRSLSDTLATLNVTLELSVSGATAEPSGNLTLYNLPSVPPLAAIHFVGLERLVHLIIFGDIYTRPSPEHGFLATLQSLQSLQIWFVELSTGKLDKLPFSLRELILGNINGIEVVPEAPALNTLRVTGFKKLQPPSFAHCEVLHELHLGTMALLNVLLDSWLVNCSRLERLSIEWSKSQTELPPKLLLGTSMLTHLYLTGGSFNTLPEGLLKYSPNLRVLQLNSNRLQTLPSSTFAVARRVQELSLTGNELESRVMDALTPLKELRELDLSFNSDLGDVCNLDGYSAIRNLTQLRKLTLMYTSVTRICKGWRENMTLLATLNLKFTDMSQLLFKDLQFTRTVKAVVELPSEALTAMNMTREDYNHAARRLPSGVSVYVEGRLDCDCHMYWTRRALELATFIHYDLVECSGSWWPGELLSDVAPEDLECARPKECLEAALPPACACSARPDDDSTCDRLLVRVRCENATLTSVPRPRAINDTTERFYELLLAHNNITDVHSDDLQHNIKELDLQYNFLERVDEETARRLGNIDVMLSLAGNPLDCSCDNAPLLRVISALNGTQIDLSDTTCSDGNMLYAAFTMSCLQDPSPSTLPGTSLSTYVVGGLAMFFALVAAVMTFLASRERRFFARAVLHRWGFVWRIAEPEDDICCYDAFVTFSHKDEEVARELMTHLEPKYRLCIHLRDWEPGRFISEQIVESVRVSRRTVALVSRHFLASSWARAEFREAHTAAMLDARPRLIVVLLEEPAALEMDEQLRRYVTTQTYLRWGEPWFWDKLAVVLPRPRPPDPETDGGDDRNDLASAPSRRITETNASKSSSAVSASS